MCDILITNRFVRCADDYDTGGGFEPSQSINTTSGGSETRTSKNPHALRPVSLLQSINADMSNGKCMIDGRDCNQCEWVVCIIKTEIRNTNVTYHVSDGTADAYLQVYLATLGAPAGVSNNVWVRVFGQIKVLPNSNTKSLHAYGPNCVKPITDMNAITLHKLSVMYSHLRNTRGQPGEKHVTISSHQTGFAPMDTTGASSYSQYSPLQQLIIDIYRNEMSDSGPSIFEVQARLGSKHNIVELRSIINSFCEEGLLYSSLDEDHHKFAKNVY